MAPNRYYSSTTRRTTLTADPGTSGTTLTVADSTVFSSLDGKFPWTALVSYEGSDREVVNVTARPTATTLTVQRGQDGTTGQAHAIGATVDHGVSARDFTEVATHLDASWVNVREQPYGATGNGTTDDAAAIQAALDEASMTTPGQTVFFPPGTYKVNSELEIKGPVTLRLDRGATILRGSSAMQYIVKNFNSSYAPTGYGGRGGITICGGTIDGAAGTFTTSCTSVVVAHADNVRIQDVTFTNVVDWHAVELNSTRNGVVRGCTFKGFSAIAAGRSISEAVQIDLAINSGALPGIGAGAYDNTPCDGVVVEGCHVSAYGALGSYGRLVGSHSYTNNVFHRKIRISGNHGEALNDHLVRGYNWIDVTVIGNTVTDSNGGVRFEVPSGATVESESITIVGNTFRNCGTLNNGASVVSGVISVAGLTSPSSVPVREVAIHGNVIKTFANVECIEAVNVADLVIGDNTIKNGTNGSSIGIDVDGCQNAILAANKIDTTWIGIRTTSASISGVGVNVTGNMVGSCSEAGIQANADSTSVVGNRTRDCGSATTAATQFASDNGMFVGNFSWKSRASTAGVRMVGNNGHISANSFQGWGTTQADNIITSGTGHFVSTTEKYIA